MTGRAELFPAPAAAHGAQCAAVAASLAAGVPFTWSRAGDAACPPAFRATMIDCSERPWSLLQYKLYWCPGSLSMKTKCVCSCV